MSAPKVFASRQFRSNKLSRPRLQLRLVMPFVVGALVATVAHGALFGLAMKDLAVQLPSDEAVLLEAWPELATRQTLLMAFVTIALLALIGVLTTHRVGGAAYRLERHLEDVLDGRAKLPCELRSGDELQELCALINDVTEERLAAARDGTAGIDLGPGRAA
ncbi:MAG: hypothetical protein AAFZ87_15020 [Planctomycetota bacterium]